VVRGLGGRAVAAFAVAAASIAVAGVAGTSAAGATGAPAGLGGGRAVVQSLATSQYGTVLVTTFGPYANVPLFELSSDTATSFACTHTVATTFEGPLTCTGPESDFFGTVHTDEWPAFTTVGPPRAGKGVRASLLGTVFRPGIGNQVTYAGHPLYLFTGPTSPFAPIGEGFFESVAPLPPWHGLWDLVSAASGNRATGPAVIGTGTLPNGERVITAEEYPNAIPGGAAVTVYTSGVGTAQGVPCKLSCSTAWIPVLTQGTPQAVNGASQGAIGVVSTSRGWQVTYNGSPLWLYGFEAPQFSAAGPGTTGSVGNGAGLTGPRGITRVIPA
jgi:predicted lipoprotein with Yx(FWY)xxD motif